MDNLLTVDEREEIQKKAFTKWINNQLIKVNDKPIEDLFNDLKDGTKLLTLLEVLCNCQLKREKGNFKVHHLNNVSRALNVLQNNKVRLVNISTNDIVDGNSKLILGLVWSIILHWQIINCSKMESANLEKNLLTWCQEVTSSYPEVNVTNFTTSWTNGLAFNALIHHFRSDLFDFNEILEKDENERVQHAFDIAAKHFNIEKLLDVEDVNTTQPDKKSLMMYIMCLYKKFNKDAEKADNLNSGSFENDETESISDTIEDLEKELEDTFIWLLDSEERLIDIDSLENNLEAITKAFYEHEELTTCLYNNQEAILKLLAKCQTLIKSHLCNNDKKKEIYNQQMLISKHWEELKNNVMEIKTKINEISINIKQKKINDFRNWLTEAEDKISRLPTIGPDLSAIKLQLQQHSEFQKEIIQQEVEAESLSNLVIADDEKDISTSNISAQLEDQLSPLKEKWDHVRNFVIERGEALEMVASNWSKLEKENIRFDTWIQKLDKRLTQMEEAAADIQVGSSFSSELIKRLEKMENEMALQNRYYSKIAEKGKILIKKVGPDSLAAIEIARKLQKLTELWDICIKRVEGLGILLSRISTLQTSDSFKSLLQSFQESQKISNLKEDQNFESGAKKRRLDSWKLKECKNAIDSFSNWLDNVESSLGMNEEDSNFWENLKLEGQKHLLDEIQSDLEAHQDEYNQLIKSILQIIEDLNHYGEDGFNLQETLQVIQERWSSVNQVLKQNQFNYQLSIDLTRILNEIEAITQVLHTHERWLANIGSNLNEIDNLNRVQNFCKLRMKSMNDQREKITDLKKEVNKIEQSLPSLINEQSYPSIGKFFEFWEEIFERLKSLNNQLLSRIESTSSKPNFSNHDTNNKLQESIGTLKDWLIKIIDSTISEPLVFSLDSNLTQKQLTVLKELERDLNREKPNYSYIEDRSRELIESNPKTDLKEKLEFIQKKWSEIMNELDSRIKVLKKFQSDLNILEDESLSLKKWIEEAGTFLRNEIAVPDIENLEIQIEQCDLLLKYIEASYNGSLVDIKFKKDEIVSQFNEANQNLKVTLEDKVLKLEEELEDIQNIAKQKKLKFEQTLNIIITIKGKVQKIEKSFYSFQNDNEKESSFSKSFVKDCETQLKAMTKDVYELQKMISTFSAELENSTNLFEEIKDRVNNIQKSIETKYDEYKLYSSNQSEWSRLVALKKNWLDKLEKILKQSYESSADAEEISENISDLENHFKLFDEEKWKTIQLLTQQLSSVCSINNSVQEDFEMLTKRRQKLENDAHIRLEELEVFMNQAQEYDQQILVIDQWLNQFDQTLEQNIENDISIEDLPEQIEQLEDEFKANKLKLDMFDQYIDKYKSEGKIRAASRLEDKFGILKKKFYEVMMKFQKFCHSEDVELKLTYLVDSLNQLQQNFIKSEITSFEPDIINSDLQVCRKKIENLKTFEKDIVKILTRSKIMSNTKNSEEDKVDNIDQNLNPRLLMVQKLFDHVWNLSLEKEKKLENLLKLSKEIESEMNDLKKKLNKETSINFEESESKINILEKKVFDFDEMVKPQKFPILQNFNLIKSDFELMKEKKNKEKNIHNLEKLEKVLKELEDKTNLENYSNYSLNSFPEPKEVVNNESDEFNSKAITLSIFQSSKLSIIFNFFTIEKLNFLNEDIKLIEKFLLTYPILNDKDYFEFEKQKPALSDAQEKMDLIKPNIDKMMIEKDRCAFFHENSNTVVKLIDLTFENWLKLRETFMKRYRKWWWAETIQDNLKFSYNQLIIWMDSCEKLLKSSCLLDDDLNVEIAKVQNESLFSQFSNHSIIYGEVKVLSQKVISQSLTKDAILLQNRFDIIDQRWEAIARELAWKREKIENETSLRDITLDFNNLTQWIAKCNLILNRLKENLETLELTSVTLNELKALEKNLPFQWLNVKTITLASTFEKSEIVKVEKQFYKLVTELPKARLELDQHLSCISVVTHNLNQELEWTCNQLDQSLVLDKKLIKEINNHETSYEQLEVMIDEIEKDAMVYGHQVSILRKKINKLHKKRLALLQKIGLRSNPDNEDYWINWLDSKIDHLNTLSRNIKDGLCYLDIISASDKIQKFIENHENKTFPSNQLIKQDMNEEAINYKWESLKQKNASFRNRFEVEINTKWNTLLLSLRELIEWVIKKKTEFNVHINSGDLATISKLQNEHLMLRHELENKRPLIENSLLAAKQHIAKNENLILVDFNESKYTANRSTSEESIEMTKSIKREFKKLSEKWNELLQQTEQKQKRLDEILKKILHLQKLMDSLSAELCNAELNKSKWPPTSDLLFDELPFQLANLKSFRENLIAIQPLIDQVNDYTTRMTGSNLLLSHLNLNKLEELNTRWKLLQVSIDERKKALEQSIIDHGSVQQQFLNDGVEHPWERAVASNKVPYYINHATETTHWDHPKMIELMSSLTEFNEVRYSAYRTALKLRAVQKRLCLHLISINTLIAIFDEHGLRALNEKEIRVPEMIACLQSIYENAAAEYPTLVDVALCIDLCLNWLLNLYAGTSRAGSIRILPFKLGIITLCKATLDEKYEYMFRLIADVQGFVNESKLAALLQDLIQIPKLLGEIAAFGGSNIQPSVRSCFERAENKNEIEAIDFLNWLQKEPQSIVWLLVLHRLLIAETAKHQVKCNVCKQYPIIGLRYRCLSCFNFDMCQMCFFSGRKAKHHKITHSMKEYCSATNSGENVRDFTQIIKNKFKSKKYFKRHPLVGYLPVQTVLEGDDLQNSNLSPTHSIQYPDSLDMHSKLELYANRLAEVELRNQNDLLNDNYNEDEHQLIAQYCQSLNSDYYGHSFPCSPAHVMTSIEVGQRDELESIIHELEEENRLLQNEYEQLKAEKSNKNHHVSNSVYHQPSSNNLICSELETTLLGFDQNDSKEAILAEAKALRIHKNELEYKKRVLEDQNRQLACSLKNLRQFVKLDHNPTLPSLINRTSSLNRPLRRNSSHSKNHNVIINGSIDLNLDNQLSDIR